MIIHRFVRFFARGGEGGRVSRAVSLGRQRTGLIVMDNEVGASLDARRERPTFVRFRVNPLDRYLVTTRTNRMLHTNNITSSRCKAMLRRPGPLGPDRAR